MRFVVYGAGGIGGVLGGLLHRAGYGVVLIARGSHYEAMQTHGLRLETPTSSDTLDVAVVDHPSRLVLTDDDVVVLAMKSQDTVAALQALPPGLPIVCVQNGVANERAALRRFADVYGVCVMCPTNFLSPGVVQNLGNAIEALCGPVARAGTLATLARTEAEAALGAAGVDFVSDEEDTARRANLLSMHPISGERRGGGSSWQSLARGTGAIETDYLNGEVVLLGRLHGLPTPVNALLQRLANQAATEGIAPGSVREEDLLAQLG